MNILVELFVNEDASLDLIELNVLDATEYRLVLSRFSLFDLIERAVSDGFAERFSFLEWQIIDLENVSKSFA
jgi:hypothetical protein